ncbi:O-antigen ligase family protein [Cytophagaceae bacterium ABcell3]|nr:O-antigen ligase family protein [Cytophagaceae bacterium ABcell3]
MITGIDQKHIGKSVMVAYAAIVLLTIIVFGITEQYLVLLAPPAILILFLAFFDFKKLFYLIFFTVPFSIDVSVTGDSFQVGTPAEPLVGLLAIVAIITILMNREDRQFLKTPLSMLILLHLGIILFTAFFTTMPVVTIKFLVVKISYILVFYFLAAKILRENPSGLKNAFILYSVAFIPVILYILNEHAAYGFDKNASNIITGPFYNDHTIYGACLCMVIPVITAVIFNRKTFKINVLANILLFAILVLLTIALFYTYSRAAWLSLGVALAMAFTLAFRIKFKVFVVCLLIGTSSAIAFKSMFISSLKQNKYDSNAHDAGIDDQLKSVTSIKTDVSNAERVNRWNSAIRMFYEKPITGFGPGTYQFQYIPFQYSKDMTEISITSGKFATNPGIGGSAHSEYLLLLSESGLLAMLSFALICFYIVYAGMDVYYNSSNKMDRILALCSISALASYITHAFFNNFLDQEEAASLFWALTAIIAVLKMKESQKSVKPAGDQ